MDNKTFVPQDKYTPNVIKNAIRTAEQTGYDQYITIDKDGTESFGRLYTGIDPWVVFGDAVILRGVVLVTPRLTVQFYSAFTDKAKVRETLVKAGLDVKQVNSFLGIPIKQMRNYIRHYLQLDPNILVPILNFRGFHPTHEKIYNATFRLDLKANRLIVDYLENPQDARLHTMNIPFEYPFYNRLEIIRNDLTKRHRAIKAIKESLKKS